jgi:heat-inducible transcriptional repressor
MILDDRKKKILQAIVEDYISTGEPVGSRTVAKKYNLGMSPATIRNDMADLEEMGIIQQPHTSAGRIPSDLGYRTYVDKIMKGQGLSQDEEKSIKERMDGTFKEMSTLIRQVSNVISKITKYTSVAVTANLATSKIKHLQLVPVDKSKILMVIVTNNGEVKNIIIKVGNEHTSEFLFTVSNYLNEKFAGSPLEDLSVDLQRQLETQKSAQKELVIPIIDTLRESFSRGETSEVFLDGASNMFNFQEFSDIARAKEFIEVLDERNFIINLLGPKGDGRVDIRIGSENKSDEIRGCSLIKTSYWIGNKHVGSIGVLGPTRMNYLKVISCIEFLRKEISDILNDLRED